MRPFIVPLLLAVSLSSCVGGIHRQWDAPDAQADYFVPGYMEAHAVREEYVGTIHAKKLRVGMSMAEVHLSWGWPHGGCEARRVQGGSAVILWGYHPRLLNFGPKIHVLCWTTGTTLTFNERGILTGWNEQVATP